MTLPPRIPAPLFVADLSDVPRLRSAARRRRAVQGGVLGALLTSFAMVVAGDSAGTRGLEVVEPARPSPTAAAQGTAAAGRAGPTREGTDAPRPGETATRVSSPSPSPYASPVLIDRGPEVPLARRMTIVPSVVGYGANDDPCIDNHTMTTVGSEPQSYDACIKRSWPATMPYAKGGVFLYDYCVQRGTLTEGEFSNPRVNIDGDEVALRVDRIEYTTVTVRAGECLRWTFRWDGMGYPAESTPENSVAVYLPRGPYTVGYSEETPKFEGETVFTDGVTPVTPEPRPRDLRIV
ncbi:MAG TPA: hypothetical protein VNQ77_11315 [Frankiaceae bacterium]|nr:hypothetical protein [Frankiaceae bacterium]